MTVIAYSAKHRIMASDSRVAADEGAFHLTDSRKIYDLRRSGAVLGLAGDADARDLLTLLGQASPARMPARAELIELETETDALLVFPTGRTYRITCERLEKAERWNAEVLWIRDRFVAIGSGKDFAYGALEAGATPQQAVEAACRRSLVCAPPVQWRRVPRGRS